MAKDREEVIDARLAKIQESINELRAEQRSLAQEREQIEIQKSAALKVAGMGHAERKAIAQIIAEAGSIESGENVQGLAS